MSAQIVAFPGYTKPEDIRQDARIETGPTPEVAPVADIQPKPPVYIRVRADAFQEMMGALSFYGLQGFDHGKKAREVMEQVFGDQPA